MIDLIPTDAQQDLVATAADFLTNEMPRTRVREAGRTDAGFDPAFLAQCGELGWFALGLAEDHGGLGLTLAEEALLFRELGRALVPGPMLGTALGAQVAAAAGDQGLADRLAAGTALAGLAEVLDGEDRVVLWDSGPTDVVLVVDAARSSLALVDRAGFGSGERMTSIDPAYHPESFAPGAVPAPIVGLSGTEALRLSLHGMVLTAATLVGIAEQTRDDSAEYAKVRVQYGKAIGTYQAVKHRCADTALRAESSWAQTVVAALRVLQAGADAEFDARASKVIAADAAIRNCRDSIQNHGGIGYTAEHDAHLFLKRAHVLEHVFGAPRRHLAVLLESEAGW